ncbi:hypothetical protein [Streptomyces sp. NPDC059819]|uniref:hypothetical protein n=1 Tax=Streptomyces sp. NPDC059819 TaxID=3346963 RepID=UPI0036511698
MTAAISRSGVVGRGRIAVAGGGRMGAGSPQYAPAPLWTPRCARPIAGLRVPLYDRG